MIYFLRSNHFGVPILSLLIMGALWVLAWAFPPPPAEGFDWFIMPAYETFRNLFSAYPVVWNGLAIVLTIAQATLLIWWNQRYEIIPRIFFLPGFFYILITGSIPGAQLMNPALIFGLLFSLALIQMMGSLRREASSFHSMGITLLITVAGFIYLWSLAYLVVVAFLLISLRSCSWRDIAGMFLGIVLPALLTLSFLYLTDANIGALFRTICQSQMTPARTIPAWPLSVWILLGYMALLFLCTFPIVTRSLHTAKGNSRKGFTIMATAAISTLVLFLALPAYHPELYWVMAIPLSVLYSCFFAAIRSKKWANFLIIFWAALILWVRIHYMFFS